jgi:hypothetical protein
LYKENNREDIVELLLTLKSTFDTLFEELSLQLKHYDIHKDYLYEASMDSKIFKLRKELKEERDDCIENNKECGLLGGCDNVLFRKNITAYVLGSFFIETL